MNSRQDAGRTPACAREGRIAMADLPLNYPPVLDARNLPSISRQVRAVRNVSFRAPRQSIFGLVGSDGAGKSSVL